MSSQTEKFSTHVRAFADLLIRLRSELGDDLDLVLILAVIAERYYAAIEASEDPEAADQVTARERYGINALSVALYAGIPRETVRRKIARLVEKGWVACDAQGNLSPTTQAAQDLSNCTAASLEYICSVTRDDPS